MMDPGEGVLAEAPEERFTLPLLVQCSTGDWAEAEDPGGAVVAARTMAEDHWQACMVQGRGQHLTFAFYCEGKHVRTVTGHELRRMPAPL